MSTDAICVSQLARAVPVEPRLANATFPDVSWLMLQLFAQLATIKGNNDNTAWRELTTRALEAVSQTNLTKFSSNSGLYYGTAGIAFALRAASSVLSNASQV